jgi:hypothetical protein
VQLAARQVLALVVLVRVQAAQLISSLRNKVYWSMDATAEDTDLINRCDESQTYEARLAAGTLPD